MKKPAQRELVFLSEIGVESCGEFGPKAERLARLLALGFPVPRGFCIESSELQRHIETHGLFPLIRQACARGADGGDAWRGPLGELRRRIIEEPLDDGLRRRIAAGLEKLGARSVAVRSSGLAEDSRVHSFAGLHDTVLAVRTDDECEEAVRACWASLFSERAFEYRRSCGIDGNRVAMAVLVEEQVTAEISGVAFGVDPAGRRLNQLVIELVRGSGSSLVSGRASPFRAKLSRSDLSILSTEGRDPGIEEVLAMRFPPAAGSRSEDPSSPLDRDELLRRVARLTLEAEAALGAPQDVEWAWDGERIHVLQSRPITPVGGARPWAAGQVWTNANAGEVIPDVVTPMTWSMVEPALVALFAGIFRLVGIDVRQITLVGRVAGRVYFNLNTAVGILRSVPFVKERDLGEMLGGMQVDPAGGSRVSIPDEDLPPIRISLLRLFLAVPRFIVWCLLHRPRRGEAFLKDLRWETDRIRERSLREISPLERTILLRDCFDIFSGDRDSLAYPMVGMIGFQSLDRVCRRWLASEGAMVAHRLVSGQRGVESAEAGLAMWDLARAARENPEVEREVMGAADAGALRERLAGSDVGRDFIARWDRLLEQHGHHARGEIELRNPRWSERPDYVLDRIRGYLEHPPDADPRLHCERAGEESRQLAARCLRRLRNPLKRVLFGLFLRLARDGSKIRENLKSEAVRRLALARKILVDTGGQLVSLGLLESTDDIFFLRIDELRDIVRESCDFDPRSLIARRRAEYERNLELDPPAIVFGNACDFDSPSDRPPVVDEMRGIAVSPGIVRGPARVITRLHDDHVRPGEILVAPFTDPGWTPYFVAAAGIVMDLGGLLSHGSIIAREYAIPAVVNVGCATRTIETGQLIEVDGIRGAVRILSSGGRTEREAAEAEGA